MQIGLLLFLLIAGISEMVPFPSPLFPWLESGRIGLAFLGIFRRSRGPTIRTLRPPEREHE